MMKTNIPDWLKGLVRPYVVGIVDAAFSRIVIPAHIRAAIDKAQPPAGVTVTQYALDSIKSEVTKEVLKLVA
jgi:hypothetical protein